MDVLLWYILIFSFGVLAAPLGFFIFGRLKDYGYPFYRVIGLGFVGFTVWLLGNLKILPFSKVSILFAILLLTLTSSLLIVSKKFHPLKHFLKTALIYETIFAVFFLIFLAFRFFSLEISGVEKFMDFAFLNSILRADYFPPADPWLAGHSINYYYFGHLVAALGAKLLSIKSAIAFNLMTVTVYSLFSVGIFSLVYNLTKKWLWAFLGVLIVAFLGNISYMAIFFQENPIFNWPGAARVIPGTINEFPLYSFLLGDMHAQFLNLPFVLLALLALLTMLKEKITLFLCIFFGGLLSILFITNSWDFAIYSFLFLILVIYKNISSLKGVLLSLKFVIPTLLVSLIGIFIFSAHINFGVANFKFFAGPRTIVGDFFKLFALQLFVIIYFLAEKLFPTKNVFLALGLIFLSFLVVFFKTALLLPFIALLLAVLIFFALKEHNQSTVEMQYIYLLTIAAFALAVFCELFYLNDAAEGLQERANTVFKLYYQMWIFLGLGAAWLMHRVFSDKKLKYAFFSGVFLFGTLSFAYMPLAVYTEIYNPQKKAALNGALYLAQKYPQDYKAIEWLNKNIKGQTVIAEKPGEDPYTDASRVSAYTGHPTPIGWVNHETFWRGTNADFSEIVKDIKTLYQTADSKTALEIVAKYKINYIFVGELENQAKLPQDNSAFKTLGVKVYSGAGVEIYKTGG